MSIISRSSVLTLIICLMPSIPANAVTNVNLHLVELPSRCLKERVLPCGLQADGRRVSVDLQGIRIVLADQAVIQIVSPQEIKIVTGHVYLYRTLQNSVEYELISEFGRVQLLKEGHLFVKKTAQNFEIYPLQSGVNVVPVGFAEKDGLFLPVGYRSHLGSVTDTKKAHYEIPVSANLKGLVEVLGPLFPGTATELTSFLNKYRTHWLEAAHSGAVMQNQWAERELASAKNEEARKQQMIERAKLEQHQIRQLFRSKNYMD